MRYFQLYLCVCVSLSLRKEDECSVSFTVQRLMARIEEQQVCEMIAGPFFRLSVSGENVHRVVSAKNKLLRVCGTRSGAQGPLIESCNKSDANQSK